MLLFCWHTHPKPRWDKLLYKHSNMEPLGLEAVQIENQGWVTYWRTRQQFSTWMKTTNKHPVSTKWRHKTPEKCNLHSANVSLRVCSCNLKVNEKSNFNFTIENIPTSPSEHFLWLLKFSNTQLHTVLLSVTRTLSLNIILFVCYRIYRNWLSKN